MKNTNINNNQEQELINTNTNTKGENIMNKITLKNRDEFIEKLTDLIVQNEFGRYPEDIDIYLYIGEGGEWTLKEFENPGGNSYLPDDHIKIWTIKEGTNYDTYFDNLENELDYEFTEEERMEHATELGHELFEESIDEILREHLLDVEWID